MRTSHYAVCHNNQRENDHATPFHKALYINAIFKFSNRCRRRSYPVNTNGRVASTTYHCLPRWKQNERQHYQHGRNYGVG